MRLGVGCRETSGKMKTEIDFRYTASDFYFFKHLKCLFFLECFDSAFIGAKLPRFATEVAATFNLSFNVKRSKKKKNMLYIKHPPPLLPKELPLFT